MDYFDYMVHLQILQLVHFVFRRLLLMVVIVLKHYYLFYLIQYYSGFDFVDIQPPLGGDLLDKEFIRLR